MVSSLAAALAALVVAVGMGGTMLQDALGMR